MNEFISTKIIDLGSCAFRQWRAEHSHCRFLHGYNLKAKIWFAAQELDDKNWIVDFGGLADLKKLLREHFDHKTCIAGDDPQLDKFKELAKLGILQLQVMPEGVGVERFAQFVWSLADGYIRRVSNGRCWCRQVEVFETESNSAIYNPGTTSGAGR